jgi:hypothetical protein
MEVRIDVYNHGFAEYCHFVERTAGPVALKSTPGLRSALTQLNPTRFKRAAGQKHRRRPEARSQSEVGRNEEVGTGKNRAEGCISPQAAYRLELWEPIPRTSGNQSELRRITGNGPV